MGKRCRQCVSLFPDQATKLSRRRRNAPYFGFLCFLSLCGPIFSFSNKQVGQTIERHPRQQVWDGNFARSGLSSLCATFQDDFAVTVGRRESSVFDFRELRRRVIDFLQQNDYEGAKEVIRGMIEYLEEVNELEGNDRKFLCEVVDEACQIFFNSAFSPPYRGKGARRRVSHGMEVLQLQLSSASVLVHPYHEIPRPSLLGALKAVTGLKESRHADTSSVGCTNNDTAYRILQRLVTGVGVRNTDAKNAKLHESDFNRVLNAYSNVGRMDMAHRIIALQQRTPQAPDLSPVAYSILLKGYGRLGDLNNIEMLLTQAEASQVEPDIIMLNSLIDAYINCKVLDKAQDVFDYMSNPRADSTCVLEHQGLFKARDGPAPNKRTYNIILKGFANNGMLKEAIQLSNSMEDMNFWDDVTTNTLVLAAVKAQDFSAAESILEEHTATNPKFRSGRHPNAEAYTTIMDGYGKAGDMQKAVGLLKEMRRRQVEANEYTYTSLIGGMARNKKVEEAKKTMAFMRSAGLRVDTVTFNAFISGILHRDHDLDGEVYDDYVDSSISMLRDMIKDGIRPNAVTISAIVGGFAKCDQPRITEAVSLLEKLEGEGIITANNTRISTALVQAYGAAEDVAGAMRTFQTIQRPDLPAINALLDSCVRCNDNEVARETFDFYFRGDTPKQRPDVVSFTIMITSLLRSSDDEAKKGVRKLYEEMKYRRRISADKALVDM